MNPVNPWALIISGVAAAAMVAAIYFSVHHASIYEVLHTVDTASASAEALKAKTDARFLQLAHVGVFLAGVAIAATGFFSLNKANS